MPDAFNSSGQHNSVRGNMLQPKNSELTDKNFKNDDVSSVASALAIQNDKIQHHQQYQQNQNRLPIQTSFIRMLPVSSTSNSFDASNQLPPSPPNSDGQSPPTQTESDYSQSVQSYGDYDSKETELRQALAQMTTNNKFDQFPDTPDASPLTISPAEALIRQKPCTSAREFVNRIFPTIIPIGMKGKDHAQRGRYLIEDAGVDLSTRSESKGAAVLIDTKPAFISSANQSAASSFSNHHRPQSYSLSSTRMSRRSSTSTSASINERSPRRTLLTQINTTNVNDANGLRACILDIIDYATEKLHVDAIMFVLNRSEMAQEEFRATVHGLCYVGATIIAHRKQSKEGEEDVIIGDESIYAPRFVGQDLVLLSVDV